MSTSTTTSSAVTDTNRRAELHKRSREFAKGARSFVNRTPRTVISMGDCRNLVRSSGYIGAHYIEADEAPSRDHFLRSLHECRRDAKQSAHWLEIMNVELDDRTAQQREELSKEAQELERIFGAIIGKTLSNAKKKTQQADDEASA